MINTAFWKNKRVFLTGHTGFKGSWLSIWLSMMSADVTGYSLKPPTHPSLFAEANIKELVSHNIGDIRNLDDLKKVMISANPEIVIHMAAQPLVRQSYLSPVETYEINLMGTVNLLESVRSCDSVRCVLNVTTDKCYENKEWIWGYRENEPMGGYDPYSNSKACSELVTSAYRYSFFNPTSYSKEHHVAIATARAGNVIGGGDWAKDRLIPDIVRAFKQNKTVKIRNPYAIRPWQHVLEPLSGYLMLAERLYDDDGIKFAEGWNFGPNDSDAKPVEWIVKKMCELWGNGATYIVDDNLQPHEASYLKLDISKASTLMSWNPLWSLEKTLNMIINWYQKGKSKDYLNICIEQINDFQNCIR